MPNREPDPRDTIGIIDRLVELKLLNEAEFRQTHHLGGSIAGFRSYCSKVKSFRANSENRRLHEALQKMLDSHEKPVSGLSPKHLSEFIPRIRTRRT